MNFIYHIDRNDIVVYCDAAWLCFAQHNGAPELDVPAVIGRPSASASAAMGRPAGG